MNRRDIVVSTVGLITIYASLTMGYGGVPDATGKPCSSCSCDGETQGGSGGDGGKDSSDPINLSTGDFQLGQTDLVIPGRGLDFEIHRFYRSYSGLQTVDFNTYGVDFTSGNSDGYDDLNGPTLFGGHWNFNYNQRLSAATPQNDPNHVGGHELPGGDPFPAEIFPNVIHLLDGTGRIDAFTTFLTEPDPEVTNGRIRYYSHDKGSIAKRLEYRGVNRTISYLDANMTEYRFYPIYTEISQSFHQFAGRLESIVDRNGNTIQFVYELTSINGAPRINYAIDTLGNHIDFVYHDQQDYNNQWSSHQNEDWAEHTVWIIADLVDEVGGTSDTPRREWRYDYVDGRPQQSDQPILSEVTLPKIQDDAEFPMGGDAQHARFDQTGDRTWQFEYLKVTQWQQRLMSKITNPNGELVLENEYWGDLQQPPQPGETSNVGRNAARVRHQHYGDATYSYIASHVNPSENTSSANSIGFLNVNDLDGDYYVWVNDRRGAITRFKYSGMEVPGDASGPFHRALLEKVEYDGFVPSDYQGIDLTKEVVWALVDANGNHTWYYIDANGDHQTFTGPSGTERYVKTWDWDDHWNPSVVNDLVLYAPSGPPAQDQDSVSYIFDQSSQDPLRWGAMLSRTRNASDGAGGIAHSITEDWLYDFEFGGGPGGSACGCGSDSFVTAYKDGNNNVTLNEYDTSINGTTGRATGNLLKIYHDIPNSTVLNAISSNATSTEDFEYNSYGQLVKHIHPVKETLTGPERREDRFEYGSDPASHNYGRMTRKIIDFGGLNLTTDYLYDAVGNLIQRTSPGGDISLLYYNQDSNLIAEEHWDSTATELYSKKEYFYDANGNVVQEEIANLTPHAPSPGGALIDPDNPSITTLYEYDKHDYLLKIAREHGEMSSTASDFTDADTGQVDIAGLPAGDMDQVATEERVYDSAKNLIKHVVGEAANNSDQTVTHYEYDARDLLVRQFYGVDNQSILVDIEFDRDSQGRIHEARVNPNDANKVQVYQVEYDGFDRVESVTDPMGNLVSYEYDDNFNMTRASVSGPYEQDTPGDDLSISVILSDAKIEYDARDRKKFEKVQIYEYNYGSSTGVGTVTEHTTEYLYNKDDSVKQVYVPSSTGAANLIEYFYDTASRLESIIDSGGNSLLNTYDADSNLITKRQSDVASDGSGWIEEYVTEYQYDALDRVKKIIRDPQTLALETLLAYDSRSNTVKQTDPRGNVTEFEFDGMDRLIQTKVLMTDTGDGSGSQISGPDGKIKTITVYDDSSRVVSETDDSGNTTSYEYDALDRIVKIVMPNTSEQYATSYDQNGNVHIYTDARGVAIENQYDRNNRLELRTITGISDGTTSEAFKYDGLGRMIEAVNNSTKVTREYDSRSNVVREIQNFDESGIFPASKNRVVQYDHDNANNTSQIVYPSGRTIDRSYDLLNRLSGISDQLMTNPQITQLDYVGNRVLRRINGNGTTTNYTYNGYEGYVGGGDKGFGRVASISTTNTVSSVVLDSFDFSWDASQNRIAYEDTGSGMVNRRERSFGYDSSNRLTQTDVDYPDLMTDYPSPANGGVTDYVLDGVNNRVDVSGYEMNGSELGSYTVNESNQYTTSPFEGGVDWIYVYDENGNMTLKAQSSIGDYNGDYEFDFQDISGFLADYGNELPDADLNGDGNFDFLDVSAFMTEYTANQGVQLQHHSYTYDYRNQLIKVTLGLGIDTNSVTNFYDSLARRVVEEIDADGDGVADAEKQLVYGCASLWEVIEQIDLMNNDAVLSTHVFGLGIDDEVHYQRTNASTDKDIWTHRDDLNSLTSITDATGTVLERFEYGDYGQVNVFDGSGSAQSGSLYTANHFYAGRLLVSGTELYDNRFRIFASDLDRFVQHDPMGYIDTMNLYSYALQNPQRYMDPFGLYSQPAIYIPGGPYPSNNIRIYKPEDDNFWVIGFPVDDNQDMLDILEDGSHEQGKPFKVCRISAHCGIGGVINLYGEPGNPQSITVDDLQDLADRSLDGPPTRNQVSKCNLLDRISEILGILDSQCEKVIFEQCASGSGAAGARLDSLLDELYPNTDWVLPKGKWNDNPIYPYDTGNPRSDW